MKRNEIKKVLKPLIKECIKEVLFEEGVLKGVISEVVKGTRSLQPDSRMQEQQEKQTKLLEEEQAQARWKTQMESRKRLLNATGIGSVDVFEGTEPLSEGASSSGHPGAQGPLSGVAPGDPGFDISGIMAVGAGKNWQKLAKGQ